MTEITKECPTCHGTGRITVDKGETPDYGKYINKGPGATHHANDDCEPSNTPTDSSEERREQLEEDMTGFVAKFDKLMPNTPGELGLAPCGRCTMTAAMHPTPYCKKYRDPGTPTQPPAEGQEFEEAAQLVLSKIRYDEYYTAAKDSLDEFAQRFVEEASWAGELHEDAKQSIAMCELMRAHQSELNKAVRAALNNITLPSHIEVGAKYEIERDWPGLDPSDALTAHNFGYDHGYNKALDDCKAAIAALSDGQKEGE